MIGGRSYTSNMGGTVEPTVIYDENDGAYHLGAEIDGTFISFVSVPGSTVEGLKAAAATAQAAEQPTAEQPTPPPPPQ